jgi:hypothetical protein
MANVHAQLGPPVDTTHNTVPQFSRPEILWAPAAPEESVYVILECCASPDVFQSVITAPLLRLPDPFAYTENQP